LEGPGTLWVPLQTISFRLVWAAKPPTPGEKEIIWKGTQRVPGPSKPPAEEATA
jgi:hypothetical protein